MAGWSKPDTLAKVAEVRQGLMDLLGEDLYKVLESGRIQTELPYGLSSKLDLRKKKLSVQKKFGKGYQLGFDARKHRGIDTYGIKLTKDF